MNTETAPESAIQPKQHFTGTVKKTTLAGAIVDIGLDKPGVIHISQLQENATNKVEDVVKEGQSVEVWVRRVKPDRIELTMIQPLTYDWKELKAEMVVKGKVVRLESYGAFVDIGAERPGMVHVSELAHGFVKTPGDVVKVDQEVEAMVLDVDKRKKQIKLSIKAVTPKPEEKEEEIELPKMERKSRNKRARLKEEIIVDTGVSEPELTAFEIAWKSAMDREQAKRATKGKKVKGSDREREALLSRTLEKRLPTGG